MWILRGSWFLVIFYVVWGRAHMQSVHAYAVQTRFSVFVFCLKKRFLWPPILEHFGGLGRTFGFKGVPRGGLGGVWKRGRTKGSSGIMQEPQWMGGVPNVIGIARRRALGRDLGIELEIGSSLKTLRIEIEDGGSRSKWNWTLQLCLKARWRIYIIIYSCIIEYNIIYYIIQI